MRRSTGPASRHCSGREWRRGRAWCEREDPRRRMKFDQPPDDVEWNDWGPPVRVKIEHGPVMLFARAVKDSSAIYASEQAASDAGFERVPVPPTYTFEMS